MGIFDDVNKKLHETVKNTVNDIKENVKENADEYYTVKSGDTLWAIAQKFYGDGNKYMKIFEANKEVWTDNGKKEDPNILFPNWVLRIPKA